jgi:hypothetical protein
MVAVNGLGMACRSGGRLLSQGERPAAGERATLPGAAIADNRAKSAARLIID